MMVWMDCSITLNNTQLTSNTTAVSPVFHASVIPGRHQIKGNANGPTDAKAKIMNAGLKYHETV